MEDQKETRHGLDRVKEALTRAEEDRDTWRLLFEDCNKKQGQEIKSLRHDYKERSERLGIAKKERPLPAGSVPGGQSPMELLALLSQITEVQVQT